MHQFRFRFIALLLVLCLTVPMLGNPVYAVAGDVSAPQSAEETPSFTTLEDAGAYVRQQMVARQPSIVFEVVGEGDYSGWFNQILDIALRDCDDPYAGDYLAKNRGQIGSSMSGYTENGKLHLTYTLTAEYYTTAEQEAQLQAKIDEAFASFGFTAQTTAYQKVRTIHDYIVSHVTYDYAHLGDESYKLQYTAYAALIDGKSVCQGFASLTYAMLKKAGMEVRTVSGIADNGQSAGPHAWNVVRMDDGKSYYLDCTWDEGTKSDRYFLVGSSHFTDHAAGSDQTFLDAMDVNTDDYVDFTANQDIHFDTYSVVLDGSINLALNATIPTDARTGDGYMQFVIGKNGPVQTVLLSDAALNSDGTYCFLCKVNSIQMADVISATYFYNGGKYSLTKTFTVQDYLQALRSDSNQSANVQDIAKALLSYGYYAQRVFSNLYGWTLDQDHGRMLFYYNMTGTYDFSRYKKTTSGTTAGVTFGGYNLELESETTMNFYFQVDPALHPQEPVFRVNGEIVTAAHNGETYCVTISNINATALGNANSVSVDNGLTVNASAMSYANSVMKSSTASSEEKELMKALYIYMNAATALQPNP